MKIIAFPQGAHMFDFTTVAHIGRFYKPCTKFLFKIRADRVAKLANTTSTSIAIRLIFA
jgi:hypothetical protein